MKTTDLSSFNNDWYNPGSKVKRAIWYFANNMFLLNPYNPFGGIKRFVLRLFGAKIGRGVVIKQRVNIKYPWNLEVGDHVWIGEDVWIDSLGKVKLGDHSCVSQGAFLLCGNHNYKKTTFDLIVGNITLEEGAWVGAKAIVTGGVIVHSHALLTAGSVASKSLEAYKIYQGNPAQIIRDRVIS